MGVKAVLTAIMVFMTVSFLSAGCEIYTDEPAGQVLFAADPEFVEIDDGLLIVEQAYGFEFDEVFAIVDGLTHEALRAGDVDAIRGFATDGKIKELDLVSLIDDRRAFSVSHPAPVVREEVLDLYPVIPEVLAEISDRLDTDTMISLNYLVDMEMIEPEQVAWNWLLEEGLICQDPGEPLGEVTVAVGSKEYVEQRIFAYITLAALDHAGVPVEDRTGLGGTEYNRSALLEGTIDLYWEYTGMAWTEIHHQQQTIDDPDYLHEKIAELDFELGLVWLDYARCESTYTILMRREHAEELGIVTVSQFANWVKRVQTGEIDN